MSDHIDGPRVMADPSIDLTDLFAFISPADATRTVLIAGFFPGAGESAMFSNVVNHSIVLRRVTVSGLGADAGFKAGHDELRFSCQFEHLERPMGGGKPIQRGTCALPDGRTLAFVVNDEMGAATTDGLYRVFAGIRSDPFFDCWIPTAATLLPVGTNLLQDDNVLCIVIEFDTKQVLDPGKGSLFGAIAETTQSRRIGPLPLPIPRYDWVGRPEHTNFRLDNMRQPDEPDLRDLWNQETPFAPSKALMPLFREHLTRCLDRWDMLDNERHWSPEILAASVNVFLDDFLLFDVSKPITEESHLEIEKSTINGHAYQTGGGRTLDANSVDILVRWLINRDLGQEYRGPAQGPTQPSLKMFPYAAPPNTHLMKVGSSIDVAAPSDQVWSLIGRFDADWHPQFAEIQLSGMGVGQLRTVTTIDGKKIVDRLEGIDNDRRSLSYTMLSGLPAANYSGELEVRPKGSGSSVHWNIEYRPDGQAAFFVNTIVSSLIKEGLNSLEKRFGSSQ